MPFAGKALDGGDGNLILGVFFFSIPGTSLVSVITLFCFLTGLRQLSFNAAVSRRSIIQTDHDSIST